MAKVQATEVEVPQPPVYETQYVLTLSREEAEALMYVANRVGGDASKTLRKVFSDRKDSIFEQLRAAGIPALYDPQDEVLSGHLRFYYPGEKR